MTNHHHLRFSLLDLSSVVLTCQGCQTNLSFPIDAFGVVTTKRLPNLPRECPQCRELWNLTTDHNPIRQLLFALAQHRQYLDGENQPVSLQFDLPCSS